MYDEFEHLSFSRPSDGVLLITIDRADRYNAMTERMHQELGEVWPIVSRDPQTRVAVITGAGKAFCAGGDLDMVERQFGDLTRAAAAMQEGSDIVFNMINCNKPIVSAINGVAVGGGLAVALLADISVIAEDATLTDGHLRLGVVAGDHAALIWPLLCGMARAKYYLMTGELVTGTEAERIGLVSRCVPTADVLSTSLAIAEELAQGSQLALRWTKRTLNHWLRDAGPIFDSSLAYEVLGFFGDDAREGLAAIRERRSPRFPSASPADTAAQLG